VQLGVAQVGVAQPGGAQVGAVQALVALDCAVDTTTPAGEAMANVLAIFAHFERRLIGQRTKEALAAKQSKRWWPETVRGILAQN
jgi:DNA invertase Pin-like site-specific DNA recombinase